MDSNYTVGELIYDGSIYDGMNTQMDDLPFYKQLLPKDPKARILELCCGTGRLTIPIAQAGYDITGVDITPSMLDQANHKAKDAGVAIQFIEADIRSMELPDQYDLIFIPFNSIHHLYHNDDLFNTLYVVKQHLKDQGLFLFDCFNPDIRYVVEGEKAQQEVASYSTADGRAVVIQQTMKYDKKSQINRIDWHYYINGKFDSTQKLDMRMYFPQELDAYLKFSGFTVNHKYGNFEGEPFSEDSNKQIYVCQKTR